MLIFNIYIYIVWGKYPIYIKSYVFMSFYITHIYIYIYVYIYMTSQTEDTGNKNLFENDTMKMTKNEFV